MQRKTLLASAVSLLLAGSAAFAFAQDAAPKTPAAPAAHAAQPAGAQQGPKWGRDGDRDHGRGEHGGWGRHGGGMARSGVIGDLRALERLYVVSGRSKELPALYNDVLAKSQNPMVRDYVYRHLARAQMQPQNPDAAIATMRKSLDENLAQDQKRHQEMEQFKARMAQRMADKQAASK